MRVAVVGGGPGGLHLAGLLGRAGHEVTVFDRGVRGGLGLVFSDDAVSELGLELPGAVRWSSIDTYVDGDRYSCGGHGFSALSRDALLAALGGASVRVGEAPAIELLAATYDLVVGADGASSGVRAARDFGVRKRAGRTRYVWLRSTLPLESFTFWIDRAPGRSPERAPHTPPGALIAHAYPHAPGESTVILEALPEVWDALGVTSIERCEELFAGLLRGHPLDGELRWSTFTEVCTERWSRGNVVLIGDAAHTTHYSIGSGARLALGDAIALAGALAAEPDLADALAAYERARRPVVESAQRAARASQQWFEGVGRYARQEPLQFAFGLLTRSRRITYDDLQRRDPAFTALVATRFAARAGVAGPPAPADAAGPPAPADAAGPPAPADAAGHPAPADPVPTTGSAPAREPRPSPPMFVPFRVRGLELVNRVVVSPMAMYSAVDGVVGDFHLVHLGARALGGAGLVMSEMVCVSARGRITPGCAGIYTDEQAAAWRRVVEFVHENSAAKIGLQLGHAGRKGSTQPPWAGADDRLPTGSWPLLAPSPIPWSTGSPPPHEMTERDLAQVTGQFAAAAQRGAAAGFDLLELHMAHGYLLSGFLSPLTNRRTDRYGDDRAHYPLEVLDAVRAVWNGPLAVRISATDWVDGGLTGDDAVVLARRLAEHGADLVDVSTGLTTPDARPEYGRSYQTPFSDRIRHEAGVPTIAVGAISSADDVNSILLAGRADLVALGRPHLGDPAWTLHAAAELGEDVPWPRQYQVAAQPRQYQAAGTARPARARSRE